MRPDTLNKKGEQMGKKEQKTLVLLVVLIVLVVAAVVVFKGKLAPKLPEMSTAQQVMDVLSDPMSKVQNVTRNTVGKNAYYEIRAVKDGQQHTFNLPPAEYEDKALQKELNSRGFEFEKQAAGP